MFNFLKRIFARAAVASTPDSPQWFPSARSPLVDAKVAEHLGRFGLHIERRASHGVNVEKASTRGAIASIFDRNAARQKADSMFFNDGQANIRRVVIEKNDASLR